MHTTARLAPLLLALASAGLVHAQPAAPEEVGPQGFAEGRPLPDLRLPTIDGAQTVDLAALRGRRVLLIEFASW